MKVIGLITEYNPFHNGHKYHIETAKRITRADYVVVIMSGNFVQRGTPAIIDKYTRAQMALENGANLVLELPTIFATSSAESFAYGSIAILEQLGIIDSVVFGSECGDIKVLQQLAKILLNEPTELKENIASLMKTGITYPLARACALSKYMDKYSDSTTDWDKILGSPNNILGIEYIKAIMKLNSPIKPVTLQRISSNFHETKLNESISSATAIRCLLEQNNNTTNGMNLHEDELAQLHNNVPGNVYDMLVKEYGARYPIHSQDFILPLYHQILNHEADTLSTYLDVTPDLANRIKNSKLSHATFYDMVEAIKTKQYTQTRIQRALIHILLNITEDVLKSVLNHPESYYARILGFQKKDSSLIRTIKNSSSIPVITKLSSKNDLSSVGNTMLEYDIRSSHLYNSAVYHKFGTAIKDEYTHGVVIHE